MRRRIVQNFWWALGLFLFFIPFNMLMDERIAHAILEDPNVSWALSFVVGGVTLLCWLLLVDAIIYLLQRLLKRDVTRSSNIYLVPVVFAVLMGVSMLPLRLVVDGLHQVIRWLFDTKDMGYILTITLQQLIATGFFLAIRRFAERHREAILRTERLQKENARIRYNQLKAKVNPHFLFNSLSTLATLVHIDGERSEQFIDHLARAYRYMLEQRDADKVPLAVEKNFTEHYAWLLTARYEQKLQITFDLPAEMAENYLLPPMTFQILIDHVIRHNRMSAKEPLHIHFSLDNDTVLVRYPVQPKSSPDLSQTDDMADLNQRIHLLTGREMTVKDGEISVPGRLEAVLQPL